MNLLKRNGEQNKDLMIQSITHLDEQDVEEESLEPIGEGDDDDQHQSDEAATEGKVDLSR
jgi:hypothetical protein